MANTLNLAHDLDLTHLFKTISTHIHIHVTCIESLPIWYKITQNLIFAAIFYFTIFTNTINKFLNYEIIRENMTKAFLCN